MRAQARTGAVLVPFVEDEPRCRHEIEHRGDDVAIETRRRLLAEFRKSRFVLRPQAVNHERNGARPAFRRRRLIRRPLEGRIAKGWGPGEREHVEVEFAGLVLAPILGGRRAGHEQHSKKREQHAVCEDAVCEDAIGEAARGSAIHEAGHEIPL
jgi:hypothetical protein